MGQLFPSSDVHGVVGTILIISATSMLYGMLNVCNLYCCFCIDADRLGEFRRLRGHKAVLSKGCRRPQGPALSRAVGLVRVLVIVQYCGPISL
jgi:hypothetical protein